MQAQIKSDEFDGVRNGYVSRINKTLNPSSQNMSVFIETSDHDLIMGCMFMVKLLLEKLKILST